MESIPIDIREKIINELSPRNFIITCSSSKSYCNNDIWGRRFEREFGFLIRYYPDLQTNAKYRYLDVVKTISIYTEK